MDQWLLVLSGAEYKSLDSIRAAYVRLLDI